MEIGASFWSFFPREPSVVRLTFLYLNRPIVITAISPDFRGAIPLFKRILAAVDGTELAEEVLEAAIAISKRFDSEVHVVHAIHGGVFASLLRSDDDDEGTVIGPDGPVEEEDDDDADSVARRMCEHAEMHGTGITVHTPEGSPGEEIVRLAEEVSADLIVLGSREKSLVRRLLVGSVSEYVIENSTVSTLIVKPVP